MHNKPDSEVNDPVSFFTAPSDAPASEDSSVASAFFTTPTPPASLSPAARARTRKVNIAVGIVAIVVVAALITVFVMNYFRGPVSAARGYVDAYLAGDAKTALQLANPGLDTHESQLLTNKVLAKAVTDVHLESIEKLWTEENETAVKVTYSVDDATVEETFKLVPGGYSYGVLRSWDILPRELPKLQIESPLFKKLIINGKEVSFPETESTLEIHAFPGRYTVSVPENEYFTVEPVETIVGTLNPKPARFEAEPSDKLREMLIEEANKFAQECALKQPQDATDCPHAFYPRAIKSGKITAQITELKELADSGFTTGTGTLTIHPVVQGNDSGKAEVLQFSLKGEIHFNEDGAPVFSFHSDQAREK